MTKQTMYDLVIPGDEGEPPVRQMYLSLKAAQKALKEQKVKSARIETVQGSIIPAGEDNKVVAMADHPLAHKKSNAVGYSRNKKKTHKGGGRVTNIRDQEDSSSKEEHNVSKTSQKKAKAPKVAKKAVAKAKANTNGKTPRTPKSDYVYTPIAASYSGNVHKVQTNGRVVSPVHAVVDGKTKCGYSTTEQSKGDKHYELQFVKTNDAVSCQRCINQDSNGHKPAASKKSVKATKTKKAKASAKA